MATMTMPPPPPPPTEAGGKKESVDSLSSPWDCPERAFSSVAKYGGREWVYTRLLLTLCVRGSLSGRFIWTNMSGRVSHEFLFLRASECTQAMSRCSDFYRSARTWSKCIECARGGMESVSDLSGRAVALTYFFYANAVEPERKEI